MRFFLQQFRPLLITIWVIASQTGCTDGNRTRQNFRVPSLYAGGSLKLDPKERVTASNKNIPIQWTTAAGSPVYRYHLKVSNPARVIFDGDLKPSDVIHEDKLEFVIPATVNDGKYQIELYGYDDWGHQSSVELGSLIVDTNPPIVHLYLGADPSDSPCTLSPIRRSHVATRLVPFEFCALDPGANPSGVTGLCLRRNSKDRSLPADTDSCWEPPSELLKLALLINGENTVQLFAKDMVGNKAQVPLEETKITLNIGHPPQVDILMPNSLTLSQEKWRAGEQKTIKWRITDDDTVYEKIKLIVTLVEVDNQANFKHLACNFANSPLWKQCPDPSIENSSLILKEGSADSGSITFTVPSELKAGVRWSENKKYLVLISAIDKSGNAAVGSPAEINAGWEVLAGRTYKGIGGSGTTIQKLPSYNPTNFIATDRRGQLFDLTNRYKINAFDYRTCRFMRPNPSVVSPFDCPDIIDTELPLQSYPWVYNPDRDVFYSFAEKGGWPVLVEIDFNQRNATIILGQGNTAITPAISSGFKAASLNASALSRYLYYDTVTKNLFFRNGGAFYKLNASDEVQYLFGSPSISTHPPNQIRIAQDTLVLPDESPFVVTKDLRVYLGGLKLDSTIFGGGYGLQYAIDSISLTDTKHSASLFMVTPNGGVATSSMVPTENYIGMLQYDSKRDRMLGAFSWRGIYQLNMPPLGSSASDYVWKPLVAYDGLVISESDYLEHSPKDSSFPLSYYNITYGALAYAGADFLYFVNGVTASILNLDLNAAALDRTVGFSIGNEPDQLAINRRLDTPHSLFLDNEGRVVFNDFYNLNRIENSEAGANPIIHTLVKSFPKHTLKFNSVANQMLQAQSGALAIYDYSDLSKIPNRLLNKDNQWTYEIQFGIGNLFSKPKVAQWRTLWDPYKGVIFKSILNVSDYIANTNTLLSNPDGFSMGTSYCGDPANPVACAGGSLKVSNSGGSYLLGSEFRLIVRGGLLEWRDRVGQIAFDATDSNIYTCLNGQFSKVNLGSQRIYPFTAKTPGGVTLTCTPTGSIFDFIQGELYYGEATAIYRIDGSTIEMNNQAVFTPIQTVAPLVSGAYGDFEITPDYVYYTEKWSSRVLRNRRIP